MNNIKYIKKLLNDHYNGNPWIDVTIVNALKAIPHDEAVKKFENLNSIWQIVNHMILWRNALLSRLKDKSVKVPSNNFISEVKNKSFRAWKDTIKKFEQSQKKIITFLNKSDETMLEKISPASSYSYYELAIAILLHDTYHLGQIVIIKKLLDKNQ